MTTSSINTQAAHIADSITKRKSTYWVDYELAAKNPKRSCPAFIEVPNANVCVWFASGDIEDTYVDDITDNRGYSLIKHEGFWKDQQESDSFNEWAVEQLGNDAAESHLLHVA